MTRLTMILIVIVSMLFGGAAYADQGAPSQNHRSFRPTWTIIGAGAGFGLGVWAGLTAFDDAINSDRKVWTTAIVSAAAAGVLGYLADRHRARGTSATNPSRASAWARQDNALVVTDLPRLGTGEFRRWLEAPVAAIPANSTARP